MTLEQVVSDLRFRMQNEEAILQKISAKLCGQLGIDPVTVIVVPNFAQNMMAATEHAGTPLIVCGLGMAFAYTAEQLHGIVAHELGHIFYGDVFENLNALSREECYRREFRADAVAKQLGYGNDLGTAMCVTDRRLRAEGGTFDETQHPPLQERLERLAA